VTLNDPQFVEAYRQLAALALKSSTDASARYGFIAQRLLGRNLTAEEIATIQDTLNSSKTYYASHAEEATKLITVGAIKADPQLNAAELAAWTVVTSQLANLDEALTK
jgi:hypothetical protein